MKTSLFKPSLALVLGAITAIAFGLSSASAYTVILDGTTVIRIENLLVPDDRGELSLYDVEFVETTGLLLYGDPADFDLDNEDASPGMAAILEVLNAQVPIPLAAGPGDATSFFIGADTDNDTIIAVGGEFSDNDWGLCEEGCVSGVTPKLPGVVRTWAKFLPAAGGPDDELTIDITLSGPDEVTVSWTPESAVLQQSSDLTEWTDSPFGGTNPAVIPASGRFYYRAVER
ncbi:MAG: hypothetical protein ACR2RV_06500 [Verrucomicrobiales bacterium]